MRLSKSLIIVIVLCLLGAWFSYLALEAHVAFYVAPDSSPTGCNISEKLNCNAAIESRYAFFLGWPIASFGFIFYVGISFFAALSALLKVIQPIAFINSLLVLTLFACLYSLFLLYVSFFELKALCPLCLVTYLINFLLLFVCWYSYKETTFKTRLLSGFYNLALLPIEFFKSFNFKKGFLPAANSVFGLLGLAAIVVCAAVLPDIARVQVLARQAAMDMQLPWPKADQEASKELLLDGSAFGDHYIGRTDAPIQLVEFFDYECPACKDFYFSLQELLKKFPEQYLLVYKNYPLDGSCNTLIKEGHANSCYAANYARCAGEQGFFNEVNEYLLGLTVTEQMDDVAVRKEMEKAATILGLDQIELLNCISSGRQLKIIQRDIEQGNKLQLTGTPTLLINGKKAPRGLNTDVLHDIFVDILKK